MDSSDVKNNQRNRSGRDGSVEDEVQKLFRRNNGKLTSADFNNLRRRYDDVELADKVQRVYLEKHAVISKKAKKFAQLIREKYSNQQYPFHILLEKARLFKVKHDLSDDEFAEFQRIYEQELVGLRSPEVLVPSTNMMKVLGSINVDFQGFSMKLDDMQFKLLQEVLKLHAASKPLHAQVLLQSMQYQDCGYEAITGEFKREHGHRPGDSVHPVVAALFLPKIDVLENHFLHSNIAGIVKARYNGEALNNKPDYELFYALTQDPNDIVCDNRSPMSDLHNRAQLQSQLWNSVLNLRNGQYYNSSFRDFISAVDMCRLNRQDNPDLVYGRYDGTVLKRLLSAFSFRPTVVATTPVYQVMTMNPYQQNVRPVVTAIPMINLKLPTSLNNDASVSLRSALEQDQLFVENGSLVPRRTSIIYSRGVLFFYVDRRANVIRFGDMQPFNVSRLPHALSGFDRLNTQDLDVELELTVNNERYSLRSIVLAELNTNTGDNFVVGSSTVVIKRDGVSSSAMLYDPLGVTDVSQTSTGVHTNKPVTEISVTPSIMGESALEMARTRGLVFMYVNESSQDGEFGVAW